MHALTILFLVVLACAAAWACDDDGDAQQAIDDCRSDDLKGWARFGSGAPGPGRTPGAVDAASNLALEFGAEPCRLSMDTSMTLIVGDDTEIPIELSSADDPWSRANGDELLIAGTDRNTDGAYLTFVWTNWCAPGAVKASLRAELVSGGVVTFPVEGSKSPVCVDAAAPPHVTTEGFRGDPVATPTLGDLLWCTSPEIKIEQGYYVAVPEEFLSDDPPVVRVADMWLWKDAPPPCLVDEWEDLRVLDGNGAELDVDIEASDGSRAPGQPDASMVRGPGSVYVKFHWNNWCGMEIAAPFTLEFDLPDNRGVIVWRVDGATKDDGTVDAPECVDDGSDSTISIGKQF
jgi:hypothetical protein